MNVKLKKFISIIASASLICSASAFAAAVRIDPKSVVEIPNRSKANDVFYEDFTSVEEGTVPSSASSTSGSDGYVTTASHDIGGGVTKNCYEIADTNHNAAYGGPNGTISVGTQSGGILGVEIRYKYVPTGSSDWASFEIRFLDSAGKQFSRTVVASANGTTNFNYGGTGNAALEKTRIAHDTWYTLNYIIDFDEQRLDAMLKNEGTGVITQVSDSEYYSETGSKNLKSLNFVASYYGGTYVIDYVRVSKESERMGTMETDLNIQKGRPAEYTAKPVTHAVAEKTNITLDGKYKYTTKDPKVEGEAVLVTAKNIASIFNLGYYITADGAVIQSGDTKFTVAKDGSGIKKGNTAMKLSADCTAEDKQVFIPIKDIAEAIGYECTYDAETNTVVITSAVDDAEKEAK